MSGIRPYRDARRVENARRRICERFLLALALLVLVRAGGALAGDQAPTTAGAGSPAERNASRASAPFTASLFSAPSIYTLPSMSDANSFSAKDFRPRGHSILDTDLHFNVADDRLINDTTVWQRLAEYRTHDRVRVLTLWESGASTVSLQAGKRGDPSLQWTSRLMNRGGATRGLLDRLFPVSSIGERSGLRSVPHPLIPQLTGKPAAVVGPPRFGASAAP
jgi:hypothetical protein